MNAGGVESSVQSILLAAGLPGSVPALAAKAALEGWALIGFWAAGVFLGLPGRVRFAHSISCSPGRQTYACYTALAIAGGVGS